MTSFGENQELLIFSRGELAQEAAMSNGMFWMLRDESAGRYRAEPAYAERVNVLAFKVSEILGVVVTIINQGEILEAVFCRADASDPSSNPLIEK